MREFDAKLAEKIGQDILLQVFKDGHVAKDTFEELVIGIASAASALCCAHKCPGLFVQVITHLLTDKHYDGLVQLMNKNSGGADEEAIKRFGN